MVFEIYLIPIHLYLFPEDSLKKDDLFRNVVWYSIKAIYIETDSVLVVISLIRP